jgi:hypothetical protein
MAPLSYRRHRFPAESIQHAIWLYLRFTLSYRDVEELLAERGLDVSYETVRRWVLKFGPLIARKLRQGRPRPSAPAKPADTFVAWANAPVGYAREMCGRVRLSSDVSEIKRVFSIPPHRPTPNFPPSWMEPVAGAGQSH